VASSSMEVAPEYVVEYVVRRVARAGRGEDEAVGGDRPDH
jgi:hypothetical protein